MTNRFAKYAEGENRFAKYAPPEPDGESEGEPIDWGTMAVQPFQGFNEGVADLYAVPERLATKALNVLSFGYMGNRDPMANDAIYNFLTKTAAGSKPKTAAGRVLRSTGKAVAHDLPAAVLTAGIAPAVARGAAASTVPALARNTAPLAGEVSKASVALPYIGNRINNAATKIAQTASRANASGAVRNLAAGIVNKPGTAVAGEMVASVGAGLGAGTAREVAPDSPMAQFAGGLLGASALPAMAYTPGAMALRGAKRLIGTMNKKAMASRSKEAAADMLAKTFSDASDNPYRVPSVEGAQSNIQEAQTLSKTLPEYNPTLAEATGSPSLARTQQFIEGGLSGPALDDAVTRAKTNMATLNRAARNVVPGPADPESAITAAGNRVDDINSRIVQEGKRLDVAEEAATSRIQPADRVATGRAMRDIVREEKAIVRSDMARVAEEFGLNDADMALPFGQYKQRLLETLKPRSEFTDNAVVPRNLANDIKAAADAQTFPALMDLRSRISDDIGDALKTPTKKKKIGYLQALKTELDNVIDDVVRSTDDPEIAERYRMFRDQYRRDYVEPFEQGALHKVLEKDGSRAYKLRDEEVASALFKAKDESAARRFAATMAQNPEAANHMRNAALDDLFDFSVRDGIIDPRLFRVWARKNARVLKQFPDVEQRVKDVGGMIDGIAARRETLRQRQATVQKSALAREMKAYYGAGKEPAAIIEHALKNRKLMGGLLRSVKTPEAKAGLKRAAWDLLIKKGAINDIEDATALRSLFGKKAIDRAQRLMRAIERHNATGTPSGRPMMVDPVSSFEGYLGTGLNQISSRVFAVKSGRTSARYVLFDILGRATRGYSQRQADEIFERALYDPKLADDLIKLFSGRAGKINMPTAKRLYAYLFNLGFYPARMSEDDNE